MEIDDLFDSCLLVDRSADRDELGKKIPEVDISVMIAKPSLIYVVYAIRAST